MIRPDLTGSNFSFIQHLLLQEMLWSWVVSLLRIWCDDEKQLTTSDTSSLEIKKGFITEKVQNHGVHPDVGPPPPHLTGPLSIWSVWPLTFDPAPEPFDQRKTFHSEHPRDTKLVNLTTHLVIMSLFYLFYLFSHEESIKRLQWRDQVCVQVNEA